MSSDSASFVQIIVLVTSVLFTGLSYNLPVG